MQIESICFGNYKNVQKKKVSKKAYPPMTKRKLKKCEPFFISYERAEKKKEHTKTNLRFIFCVANVAVMAKVTSMAMEAVTGDGRGGFHCNSGSDGQLQR